ncbi:MAG: domain S-box-containing protein, partial [Verrucomicrobiales bacterium]|nr:domain S-box-containing protein [Verrucomicrobiales bacterium]
ESGAPYAMAFVDVRMPPGLDGVETTQKLWELDPSLQVVLCTAYSDYSWSELYEKLGNHDGLLILKKPFDDVEAIQLACALTEKWSLHKISLQKMEELEGEVAKRTVALRETNQTLQLQQLELRALFDLIPAAVWFKDGTNRILRINERAAQSTGKSVKEVEGRIADEILPTHAIRFFEDDNAVMNLGKPRLGMIERTIDADGREKVTQTDKVPVLDAEGKVFGIVVMVQDITERTRLETQAFQSQKIELVGKLAGGVAHEFNSLLTAIIGMSELLLIDIPEVDPLRDNVVEIRKAARKAAGLTRQLLAYGGKQRLKPEIVDLNDIVAGMEGSLSHFLGKSTEIRIRLGHDLKKVKVDPGQIQHAIMNLVMNAGDAMPEGGRLAIETTNMDIDENSNADCANFKSGSYVMIAVSDTGIGMSKETKARAFEPFFTTKRIGNGTGLGLATCYGILKQSGGQITVESEPGEGATFRLYLPSIDN